MIVKIKYMKVQQILLGWFRRHVFHFIHSNVFSYFSLWQTTRFCLVYKVLIFGNQWQSVISNTNGAPIFSTQKKGELVLTHLLLFFTNSEGCVYPEHAEGFPDPRSFQVRYYTLPEDTQLPEHSERSPLGKSYQRKFPQSVLCMFSSPWSNWIDCSRGQMHYNLFRSALLMNWIQGD